MSEPRVIYRRTDRDPERAGRPPVRGSFNPRRLPDMPPVQESASHGRRAFGWRGALLLLGVAIVVIAAVFVAAVTMAARPASAFSCFPPAPCDAVGDPPIAMPAPPFGACPPDVVIMCPRVAVPVVMR